MSSRLTLLKLKIKLENVEWTQKLSHKIIIFRVLIYFLKLCISLATLRSINFSSQMHCGFFSLAVFHQYFPGSRGSYHSQWPYG